jgi:glycosyltransferase involved in cell wall biosynthesis
MDKSVSEKNVKFPKIKLSIVIPAFNAEETLPKLLNSLKTHISPNIEVIVVDDHSTDRTPEIARTYSFVHLVELECNSGPARARNKGVEAAKGEIIWFLDADTILDEYTLKHLLKMHEDHPKAVGIQGCYMAEPANPSFSSWYKALTTAHWFHTNGIKKCFAVETNNGSVLRSSFLEVGGFNEDYIGADVEDYEIGYRLTENGSVLLLDPDLRVYHHFPSLKQNIKNYAKRGYMWTKLFLRRRKFDAAGSTSNEALGRLTGSLFFISCIFYILAFLIIEIPFLFLMIPIILGILYFAANFRLFNLFLQKRGALFLAGAVPVHIIESLVILSAACGAMIMSIQAISKSTTKFINQQRVKLISASRLFLRLIKSVIDKKHPGYLIYFVTSRCNARCEFCFYWKSVENTDKSAELSLDEINRLAASFTHLVQLTITGGEPFLRLDIADVIRAFTERSKVPMITIPSNGFLPDRIENAMNRMLSENPYTRFTLPISIDALDDEHDAVRRFPGGFQRICQTDRMLAKLKQQYNNLVTSACITMNPRNEDRVEEIAEGILNRFSFDYVELLLARGETRTEDIKKIPIERYINAVNRVHDLNSIKKYSQGIFIKALWRIMTRNLIRSARDNNHSLPCIALRKFVEIDYDGTVFPCEIISSIHDDPSGRDFKLRNIREYNFNIRKAIDSYEAHQIREFIESVKCHCTFECIHFGNIVFTPSSYPGVFREVLYRQEKG